jgi:hypothetical protein
VSAVKETIHSRSTFRSSDKEQLKKAVTDKIGKLVNNKLKKAG